MLTNYYYPIRKTLAETFIYDVKINKDETLKVKKS